MVKGEERRARHTPFAFLLSSICATSNRRSDKRRTGCSPARCASASPHLQVFLIVLPQIVLPLLFICIVACLGNAGLICRLPWLVRINFETHGRRRYVAQAANIFRQLVAAGKRRIRQNDANALARQPAHFIGKPHAAINHLPQLLRELVFGRAVAKLKHQQRKLLSGLLGAVAFLLQHLLKIAGGLKLLQQFHFLLGAVARGFFSFQEIKFILEHGCKLLDDGH